MRITILFFVLIFYSPQVFALEPEAVVGNYELTGVMEMAGGLSLMPKHKYRAGFSYGAADWIESGVWRLEGDEVVLSESRFEAKNADLPSPFLPAGTRFRYQAGKLTGTDPARRLVFIDPNKTPSPADKGASGAGEGRMRVKGTVVQLDDKVLVINTGECIQFDVGSLSDSVLKTAKKNFGKPIDVEIPYSSIIGSASCP